MRMCAGCHRAEENCRCRSEGREPDIRSMTFDPVKQAMVPVRVPSAAGNDRSRG